MADALGQLTSIGGGLIWSIVKVLGIVIAAVIVFYTVRWIQKSTKKQKAFNTNAIITDMNGILDFDKLAFVKSDEGLLEMNFQIRKVDTIPPIPKHLIRNNYVLLMNYAPGHYCVVDTQKTQENYRKGIKKIVYYNLGMKKYITAKQREILNKAEDKKRKWEQYAPWISLVAAILIAALLAWGLFFAGAKIQASNIAQRMIECGQAAGRF